MSAWATRLAAALAALGIAAHLFWLYHDIHDERLRGETRQSLRRLAALTIRNFPLRDLDSAELFWKSINREGSPMQDHWGTEYRLSLREDKGKRNYAWASAGPDGRFGTRDDILVEVPYPDGPVTNPDLLPGEPSVRQPISNDAK